MPQVSQNNRQTALPGFHISHIIANRLLFYNENAVIILKNMYFLPSARRPAEEFLTFISYTEPAENGLYQFTLRFGAGREHYYVQTADAASASAAV